MEDRIARIAKKVIADETVSDEPVEHDIDISCFYDGIIGDQEYKKNFKPLDNSDHYGHHLFAYGFDPDGHYAEDLFKIADYDKFADYFGSEYDYRLYIDDIDAGALAEKIIAAVPLEQLSSMFLEDFEGKNDFADWIEERSEEEDSDDDGKYGWLMDLLPDSVNNAINDEAKLMVDYPSLNDMLDAVADDEGGIELKEGWDSVYVEGNSKGEYATVFGKSDEINLPGMDTVIKHMLYDLPIYCRIEIDKEEYYVDSEMEDNYHYDKEEVIDIMKRLMGDQWDDQIEEYLEDNLPEYPECYY